MNPKSIVEILKDTILRSIPENIMNVELLHAIRTGFSNENMEYNETGYMDH